MRNVQFLKLYFKYTLVLVLLGYILLGLTSNYFDKEKFYVKPDIPDQTNFKYESPWTWVCDDSTNKCQRTLKSLVNETDQLSLKVCWLKCGADRTLWPAPTGKKELGENVISFDIASLILKNVVTESQNVNRLVTTAFQIFHLDLRSQQINGKLRTSKNLKQIELSITIIKNDETLSLLTDESYDLDISNIAEIENILVINITSNTFFGARHGLETLSQLIIYENDEDNVFKILSPVKISDKPKFPYRGILIDTARNFIPLRDLKRLIRGMSYNKLNMLHLHLTDSNSFPVLCPSVPEMANYGAYSETKIYYPNDLKDLIKYALVRGVKIIPEIDAPAHAGHGWEWGTERGLGLMTYCIEEEPWSNLCGQPPCGQLNPINPNVYDVLELIYKDLLQIFDGDLFHMGGDEVTFKCWDNKEIELFMIENKFGSHLELWAYFQKNAFERLRNHSTKGTVPILWTSKLTASLNLKRFIQPTDYIIQSWESDNSDATKKLLKEGFPVILSPMDVLYLDWGAGSWLGKNHDWKYINWQTMYDLHLNKFDTQKKVLNKVLGIIPQVLGAEATLWSEKVDSLNIDPKIWPRASALAERLWTNPRQRKPTTYTRILWMTERMKSLGISADTRQPLSCILVSGNCDTGDDKL